MRAIKVIFLVVILVAALLSGAWAGLHSRSAGDIALYSSPSEHADIIERVSPNRSMVAIYQSGQWLKVGDVKNGLVGWVQLTTAGKINSATTANASERALIEAMLQQLNQFEVAAEQQEHELWLQSDTPVLEFYILPERRTA